MSLKSSIHIVLDAHTDKFKKITRKSRLRQQLSKYDLIGHDSRLRGILILIEKSSGATIENLVKINNNTLSFDAIMSDQMCVLVICVYGPSADAPEYWDKVFEHFHVSSNKLKLVTGDFNVVLNPNFDGIGYITDPHPRGRVPINHNIGNALIKDIFRVYNCNHALL